VSVPPRPIAVVLDGPPTPAWQARALAGLHESPVLEVIDVRLTGPRRRGVALRLHAAVERHLFRLGSDALAPVSLERAELVQSVSSQPAALVVWLSVRPPPEDDARDLLSLRHGHLIEPAEDAFRRAVLGGQGCVESEVLLRRAGRRVVVERTFSGVRPFSATLGLDLALWKLTAVIVRAAERVPGSGLQTDADEAAVAGTPATAALIARAPGRWTRALTTRLLFRRPWSVRVRTRDGTPTRGWSQEESLVRWKRGHVYADPFLFEHEGRHHLFCEDVPPGRGLGVISHTELRLDGVTAEPPVPVLRAPYHLSYPFVFTHEGEVFMIPETSAVRRVELYRAVALPHQWRRESVLLDDVDAADATLLRHDGRFWLFASVAAPGASSLDELHLFWAEVPQGPWCPHPRNPVVSDARCARPGGAICCWGSRLVRPAQDGSRRYGGAISFRQIDVLGTGDYLEHEIARLEPADLGGDVRATHSYACDERFEAIDLRRRELRSRLWSAQRASGLRRAVARMTRQFGRSVKRVR
jgi:hypothetical protein